MNRRFNCTSYCMRVCILISMRKRLRPPIKLNANERPFECDVIACIVCTSRTVTKWQWACHAMNAFEMVILYTIECGRLKSMWHALVVSIHSNRIQLGPNYLMLFSIISAKMANVYNYAVLLNMNGTLDTAPALRTALLMCVASSRKWKMAFLSTLFCQGRNWPVRTGCDAFSSLRDRNSSQTFELYSENTILETDGRYPMHVRHSTLNHIFYINRVATVRW